MDIIVEKLVPLVNRYEEITRQLSLPDISGDQSMYRKLMIEQNDLLLMPITNIIMHGIQKKRLSKYLISKKMRICGSLLKKS